MNTRMKAVMLMMSVAVLVLGVAAPAYAHGTSLSGETTCADGNHVVIWHISNTSQTITSPETIVSATAKVGGTTYDITGYSPTVAKGGSTDGTSVIPGNVTGTVTGHVEGHWVDQQTRTATADVVLEEDCIPVTTTSTTTTTVPPSTTTTTVPPSTSTTQPLSSSTTSTTQPPGVTTTTTPKLPKTGTGSSRDFLIGVGLVSTGLIMTGGAKFKKNRK